MQKKSEYWNWMVSNLLFFAPMPAVGVKWEFLGHREWGFSIDNQVIVYRDGAMTWQMLEKCSNISILSIDENPRGFADIVPKLKQFRDEVRTFDMTCSTVADCNGESAGFDAFELGVKTQNAFNFGRGNLEIVGCQLDGVIGNIPLLSLNGLQTADQITRFRSDRRQTGLNFFHNTVILLLVENNNSIRVIYSVVLYFATIQQHLRQFFQRKI